MRRIPDNWSGTGETGWAHPEPCVHPEHNPPMHVVLDPGTYEHVCPGCSNRQFVVVPPGPRL